MKKIKSLVLLIFIFLILSCSYEKANTLDDPLGCTLKINRLENLTSKYGAFGDEIATKVECDLVVIAAKDVVECLPEGLERNEYDVSVKTLEAACNLKF